MSRPGWVTPCAGPTTKAWRYLTQQAMEYIANQRLHVEPLEIPGGYNAHVAYPEPIADAINQAAGGLPLLTRR